MRLTLLTNGAELESLALEWAKLWHRVPNATPFQSPCWLLPWWRQFGNGAPHVVALWRADELVGVLPLYVHEGRLLPIGAGLSDNLDALAIDGRVASDLLSFGLVEAERQGLSRCDLIELPQDALLLQVRLPPGWNSKQVASEPCPVLALSTTLESTVPPRAMRKLRMNRHRAERAGDTAFIVSDPANVTILQDRLMELHQARWTERSEPGVFSDDRVRAMHRDAAAPMLASDLLRLGAIRIRDEIAAVIMALLSPGRIYFYLSGFDGRFSYESPGTVLLGWMLEQAIQEGRTEANFLRGAERYKYAWGAVDRSSYMRLLQRF